MSFAQPWFLVLLLLVPLLWLWQIRRDRKVSLRYSSTKALGAGEWFANLRNLVLAHIGIILRSAVIILLCIVMARPQFGRSEIKRNSEGLDIVLAIDTSGSMRALDFEVEGQATNRLMAVKSVIQNFIKERPDDRISMVVFGTEAFTQAPLTLDHRVLLEFLRPVKIGMAGDATAIGDAIATATKRVKDVEAKSKIVILLTDGENTAGSIDPKIAAKAAAALGIKIYTIGVGREGEVPIPVDSMFGRRIVYRQSDLDEPTLKEIADLTKARFFRAYDTKSLAEIYDTIDKLEKTKIEVKEYRSYEEAYAGFLWPGLFLLLGEMLFALTRFKRIP